MDAVLGPIQDLLGGGTLSLWMIGGGIVVIWLGLKIVKMATRVAALAIGGAMILSSAPWSSAGMETPTAACARQAVQDAMTTVESFIAKRITVKELSDDATCNGDESGLARGTATARLRTFYDIPFQEYYLDGAEVTTRLNLPDVPQRSESS